MKMVSCAETHTLFLTEQGEVYSCGDPLDGKLGLGIRDNL
jgi:alpha-tubulin suppressor-like RCC1 family protein